VNIYKVILLEGDLQGIILLCLISNRSIYSTHPVRLHNMYNRWY